MMIPSSPEGAEYTPTLVARLQAETPAMLAREDDPRMAWFLQELGTRMCEMRDWDTSAIIDFAYGASSDGYQPDRRYLVAAHTTEDGHDYISTHEVLFDRWYYPLDENNVVSEPIPCTMIVDLQFGATIFVQNELKIASEMLEAAYQADMAANDAERNDSTQTSSSA